MILGEEITLNNGNKRHTGRFKRSKAALEIERIGEENCINNYKRLQKYADEGDKDVLKFLLNKIMADKKPESRTYLSIDLKPITSVADITDNESTVLDLLSKGSITLEVAQQLYALLEQCRKTREILDIDTKLNELRAFIKESKQKK